MYLSTWIQASLEQEGLHWYVTTLPPSGQKIETYIVIWFQVMERMVNQSIKCIYEALFTSADVTKCYTETQPKIPNSKQCRRRSTVARKNSLESQDPRKKPKEEPSSEGWPVLFLLCRVEIITEHGQDVQIPNINVHSCVSLS